ncbi:short-chain dehydrogenase/reductase [Xylariales sp. PMI_506]|nr:short-chain dehydrogenase/reductase [Xylariales sp. PMI_506]
MAESFTSVPAVGTFGCVWYATRHPPTQPTASYAGKVVLVTGANAGLGFQAAKKFAALGAKRLLLAVRSLERGRVAQARIEKETGCASDVIELLQLDMDTFASMDSFLAAVNEKVPEIHVAVLNAGLNTPYYTLSPEGWEICLQVNAISTIYLAIGLLPKLRLTARASGRASILEIVNTIGHGDIKASTVADPESILSKLNDSKNFALATQYSASKLLSMWGVKRIADRVDPSEVIVLAACPNVCRSDMGSSFKSGLGLFLRVADRVVKTFIGRTAEEGGRILVNATNVGPEAHGAFLSLDQIAVPGDLVTSSEGVSLGDQAWKEILSVLRERNPNIDSILQG